MQDLQGVSTLPQEQVLQEMQCPQLQLKAV